MDPYEFEELAFCEEGSRPLQDLEDESKYIQAVFDEENALYMEDRVTSSLSTRKKYLSKPEPNNLKNYSRRFIKRKAEVWIVNHKYKAKQKSIISEYNAALGEENSADGSKAVNYDDLSCEGKVIKSKVKIGIIETSQKEKLNINSTMSNNVNGMNGKQVLAEKVFKDHEAGEGDCKKDVGKDCDLCIEKFVKTISPGYSVKEEHCYSIPLEEDDDVHQCNLCELKFKETDDLKTHLRSKHVLQLRKILKNCFHVKSINDLKNDSLIEQVLPEDRRMKY